MIQFKSVDHIYHKERIGLKPNTIREIDLSDDRFLALISKAYSGFDFGEILIRIVNADTGAFFERNVEDITIYKNLMIISWEHKEDNNQVTPNVNAERTLEENKTKKSLVSPDTNSKIKDPYGHKELFDKDYHDK